MNIYVVPEIDIERFKETGVFAVQLLNNEAMAHDGIYLESDRAKEFAEFFKDNIFPAEKFEELVEWGIKADAESASLVRAIIHSRVWEYEQKRAMTMDQVLVHLCIREYPSVQMQQKQVTLTYNAPYLMKDNNPSWNGQALQMERIRQSQKATTEAVNAMLWEKLKAQESVCACQEREIYLLKRKVQNEQEKAEISKAIADQKIAVLTQQLEKKEKAPHIGRPGTSNDRILGRDSLLAGKHGSSISGGNTMPNKYIDVRINEERFCTEGIAEFSLLNMDALNEDGYVVRWNAIQQIGRFFEENIFSTKDYQTARGEKEPDLQEAKRLRKAVEDAFEKYNRTHENSADQEIVRYCTKITPKELAWWEESWQVTAEYAPLRGRKSR